MDILSFIGRVLLIAVLTGVTSFVFMVALIIWLDNDKNEHLKK